MREVAVGKETTQLLLGSPKNRAPILACELAQHPDAEPGRPRGELQEVEDEAEDEAKDRLRQHKPLPHRQSLLCNNNQQQRTCM